MKSILIVKTGTTFPTLKQIKGDFDGWVMRGLGRDCEFDIHVVRVCDGAALPPLRGWAGVIVTGSHSMVTDREPWSERTAEWLVRTVKADVPTLGYLLRPPVAGVRVRRTGRRQSRRAGVWHGGRDAQCVQ
jgi:GMP synthase (glutamine-hydrolysing)